MTSKTILSPCSYSFSNFFKKQSLSIFFTPRRKSSENLFLNICKLQAMPILLFICFEVILVGNFFVAITAKNTKNIREIEGMCM